MTKDEQGFRKIIEDFLKVEDTHEGLGINGDLYTALNSMLAEIDRIRKELTALQQHDCRQNQELKQELIQTKAEVEKLNEKGESVCNVLGYKTLEYEDLQAILLEKDKEIGELKEELGYVEDKEIKE